MLAHAFVFAFSASAQPQCSAPHYRVGQTWEDSESSVLMAISIPLTSFEPHSLVCLAQVFKKRYENRNDISILIFSSQDAAERYVPNPPDYVPGKDSRQQKRQSLTYWVSQLHGFYSYDAQKHEEYLDIRPFGSDVAGGPYDTRINLPTAQIPQCRVELSGRCILALERISYPDAGLAEKVSGTVALTGSIGTNGKMVGIHAVEVRVIPSGKEEVLVSEALRALSTWRFESRPHQDPFEITFSYVIDPALNVPSPYRKQVDARLDLPHQVTIRGRSLD